MFIPSPDEFHRLRKGLLSEAQSLEVADELRGWNWDRPPMQPAYDTKLAVYEIAGQYCPTGRDLYLRRVLGYTYEPTEAMLDGRALHELVAGFVVAAKRLLYLEGPDRGLAVLPGLEPDPAVSAITRLGEQATLLWGFMRNSLVSRIQEALASQRYVGVDSLVAQVLPVTVEHKLDGSSLGLSSQLSCDAAHLHEMAVVDIKFARPRPFHRLATTGYALAWEAAKEAPVNLGCIVYVRLSNGRVGIERDYHLIDNDLRQWFTEARDERARMVEEEIDPARPGECPEGCPFWATCAA